MSGTEDLTPPFAGIVELLDGFKAFNAVFTATSQGIFDRLHLAPACRSELAGDLNCAEHALERLLGLCAGTELIAHERWAVFIRVREFRCEPLIMTPRGQSRNLGRLRLHAHYLNGE